MFVGSEDKLWEAEPARANTILFLLLSPRALSFLLAPCLYKTHFSRHRIESSELVTQIQVLIALWCNATRPLVPATTKHRSALCAERMKEGEVSNCFWLSRAPHPQVCGYFADPLGARAFFFNEIASCLCQAGQTEDSRWIKLAFYQSIPSILMLGGSVGAFHLAKTIGQ